MSRTIYLDWNSSGKIHPDVTSYMIHVAETYHNPASKHLLGQKSKMFLNQLKRELLHKLDAYEYDVIFTSGATEANYYVTQLFDNVYVSDIEHASLRENNKVNIIPVNHMACLDSFKFKKPFLLSYMLANHETGIINSLAPEMLPCVKIQDSKASKCTTSINNNIKTSGYTHSDMVQAFGRIPISLKSLDVDYATISAHKHGGPVGIGALLYKKTAPMKPFTWGPKIRNGTEPLMLIAGLVKTLSINNNINNSILEKEIDNNFIVGNGLARLPNTTCLKCYNKTRFLMKCDMNNICISSGAACTAEVSDRAHSVYAMGIDSDTIRVSSGWNTSQSDFQSFAELFNKHHYSLDS